MNDFIQDPSVGLVGPKLRLHPKPLLFRNYLIIDGPARVGKMFTAILVSNLERVEFAYIAPIVEHVGTLWRMGLLDNDSALAMLQLQLDNAMYDPAVGRHLNTRPGDILSVYKSLEFKDVLHRTFLPDGAEAVARINDGDRIPCLIGHDMLPNYQLFFRAVPTLRFVYTQRHPVDAASSWYKRGWGERYGSDPRAFSPVLSYRGEPLPWWAVEWADEYLTLTPLDRSIRGSLYLTGLYRSALTGAPHARVHTVTYENLVTMPRNELERVAQFLGTWLHPSMDVVFARERIPTALPVEARRAKLREMQSHASPDMIEMLLAASAEYEERCGLEPIDG